MIKKETPIQDEECMKLAGAVIRQAIADLRLIKHKKPKTAEIGRDAYEFLSGDRLDKWCAIFGVSADYIRKQLSKTCDLFK